MTRLGALAAFLLAGCPDGQPVPAPERLDGSAAARCYALRYEGGGDIGWYPVRIGFPAEGNGVWAEPADEAWHSWEMFAVAWREPALFGSSRATFSNGFSQVVLTFRESGDALRGKAHYASDVVGRTPPPRTPFTGSRIPCPGP